MTLPSRAVRAVLFDLDGTMLDTAADIANALNAALAEQRLAPVPPDKVRTFIGRGVPTLIERAVAYLGAAGCDTTALQASFHVHYARIEERDELSARVYPGVAAGLGGLYALGLGLAVVTNKPSRAARDLLKRRGLARWIRVVVGGDGDLPRKPHPQPLLRACQDLGVAPAEALMVGDSLVDVRAARAAGLAIVCVPYGYNEGNDPRALPCDAFIESVAELPALIAAAAR